MPDGEDDFDYDSFYDQLAGTSKKSSPRGKSDYRPKEGSDNPLWNFLRYVSRPYYAATSLAHGDVEGAARNVGQFLLDTPTGGGFSRDASLANMPEWLGYDDQAKLPDFMGGGNWLHSKGDITNRSEQNEATDLLALSPLDYTPESKKKDPSGLGMAMDIGVDVVGGVFGDPLTYLTGGGAAIPKTILTGAKRGRAALKILKATSRNQKGLDAQLKAAREVGEALTREANATMSGTLNATRPAVEAPEAIIKSNPELVAEQLARNVMNDHAAAGSGRVGDEFFLNPSPVMDEPYGLLVENLNKHGYVKKNVGGFQLPFLRDKLGAPYKLEVEALTGRGFSSVWKYTVPGAGYRFAKTLAARTGAELSTAAKGVERVKDAKGMYRTHIFDKQSAAKVPQAGEVRVVQRANKWQSDQVQSEKIWEKTWENVPPPADEKLAEILSRKSDEFHAINLKTTLDPQTNLPFDDDAIRAKGAEAWDAMRDEAAATIPYFRGEHGKQELDRILSAYQDAMGRIAGDLQDLGIMKNEGRFLYYPHQALPYLQAIMDAAHFDKGAKLALKSVFSRKRQFTKMEDYIVHLQKIAKDLKVSPEDAGAIFSMKAMHLKRVTAHNRTVYATGLKRDLEAMLGHGSLSTEPQVRSGWSLAHEQAAKAVEEIDKIGIRHRIAALDAEEAYSRGMDARRTAREQIPQQPGMPEPEARASYQQAMNLEHDQRRTHDAAITGHEYLRSLDRENLLEGKREIREGYQQEFDATGRTPRDVQDARVLEVWNENADRRAVHANYAHGQFLDEVEGITGENMGWTTEQGAHPGEAYMLRLRQLEEEALAAGNLENYELLMGIRQTNPYLLTQVEAARLYHASGPINESISSLDGSGGAGYGRTDRNPWADMDPQRQITDRATARSASQGIRDIQPYLDEMVNAGHAQEELGNRNYFEGEVSNMLVESLRQDRPDLADNAGYYFGQQLLPRLLRQYDFVTPEIIEGLIQNYSRDHPHARDFHDGAWNQIERPQGVQHFDRVGGDVREFQGFNRDQTQQVPRAVESIKSRVDAAQMTRDRTGRMLDLSVDERQRAAGIYQGARAAQAAVEATPEGVLFHQLTEESERLLGLSELATMRSNAMILEANKARRKLHEKATYAKDMVDKERVFYRKKGELPPPRGGAEDHFAKIKAPYNKAGVQFLERNLGALEPRGKIMRFFGGGMSEVWATRNMSAAEKIEHVKKNPSTTFRGGEVVQYSKGVNQGYRAALTTDHPAHHFRNHLSSSIQAAFDPDIGIRVGLDSFFRAFNDIGWVQSLGRVTVPWSRSDINTAVRYVQGDPTAVLPGKYAGRKIGGHDATEVLENLRGMVTRPMNRSEVVRMGNNIPKGEMSNPNFVVKAMKWWREFGEATGEYLEGGHRAAAYMHLIEGGKFTPAEAAKKTGKAFVEYELNSVAERVFRDLVLFGRFMIGSQGWIPEFMRRPAGLLGGGTGIRDLNLLRSYTEGDGTTPREIGGNLAIPTGQDEQGSDRYVTGLGLPHSNALEQVGMAEGVSEGLQKGIGSHVTPLLRTGIEQTFDTNFRFGGEANTYKRPMGVLKALPKDLMPGDAWYNDIGFWNSIMNGSPLARYNGMVDTIFDDRKGATEKLAELTTGYRTRRVEAKGAKLRLSSKALRSVGIDPNDLPPKSEWANLSDATQKALKNYLEVTGKMRRRSKKGRR